MIGVYFELGKTWIDTPPERQDCIIVLLRQKLIKQAVGRGEQKSEILAIPNQYKNMLDDLVDSSDLEHPEILHTNGQKKCNPTPNFEDKLIDIETALKDFPNISQQKKRALKVEDDTVFQLDHNVPLVGQEEYKKG